jgi:hypothetical protein
VTDQTLAQMFRLGVGNGEIKVPTNAPMFVLKLIKAGQSPGSGIKQTFNDIFSIL